MSDTLGKILVVLSLIALFVSNIKYKNEIADLKAQLDDPHHCVSICVEEFAKMGC